MWGWIMRYRTWVIPTPMHVRLKLLNMAGLPYTLLSLAVLVGCNMTCPTAVPWPDLTTSKHIVSAFEISKFFFACLKKQIKVRTVVEITQFDIYFPSCMSPPNPRPFLQSFWLKVLGVAELFAGCKSICNGFRLLGVGIDYFEMFSYCIQTIHLM